jgi:uncharacterized protein with ATP-grasp and redox domains
MRTATDCYPCVFRQIVKTGRLANASEPDILRAIREFSAAVNRISPQASPAEIGGIAYRILSQVTGVADPYRDIKRGCIREALALYPSVKELVAAAPDKLLAAAKAAIAGNVIDFGVDSDFDMMSRVRTLMDRDLAVNHLAELKRRLSEARSVLYLADNAGETVFDRILIEELLKPVSYAVRGGPIINDATLEDAVLSGLNGMARIVSMGCALPGAVPDACSDEFQMSLRGADLIISKGQGNYEGLSEERLPVFFLLTAKCEAVARDIRVKPGDPALLKSPNYFSRRA